MNKSSDVFLHISFNVDKYDLMPSIEETKELLLTLASSIEMLTICEPIITIANNNPGLEGYVAIDESNITISTYTLTNKIVISVHSCRNFNAESILTHIYNRFASSSITYYKLVESEFQKWNIL